VVRLGLTGPELAHKLKAAWGYRALRAEVQAALAAVGPDAFAVECLRPVPGRPGQTLRFDGPPFSERHGERQVAAGYYDQVLRYRQHVLPVVEAVRRHVRGRLTAALQARGRPHGRRHSRTVSSCEPLASSGGPIGRKATA
jgi:hypothetical protein